MSYLDTPRLHFSGNFLADPSTLNNTPNNFNPNNDFPSAERDNLGLSATNNLDLFWNPYGQGTFALSCKVCKVTYCDGSEATTSDEDPIIGTTVVSNLDDAPAKIVDLDPMQQNVSELWGMNVTIGAQGSGSVRGDYREGPYTWIWLQAKGVPPGDVSGSGMYQSVLGDLDWAELETSGPQGSRFLRELRDASPDRLSINFAVHAHNSNPHTFLVSNKTIAAMQKDGVPSSVTNLMKPLTAFRQLPDATPGLIPTQAYFEVLVKQFIGTQHFDQYQATILHETEQPYLAPTPHPFVHGGTVGTIGPSSVAEPVYFTPARVLTPSKAQLKSKYGPYGPPCNFAPCATRIEDGKTTIVVNLNNSLPTKFPGSDWDPDILHDLYLCTFDIDADKPLLERVQLLAQIDYADDQRFWTEGAGVVTITTDVDVSNRPLGLASVDQGKPQEILLKENPQGIYFRADKFVFRMNPAVAASESPGFGSTATVDFYASCFGNPLAGAKITVSLLSPEDALNYTNSTPGTGGSPGVDNLSIPQSSLRLATGQVVTDASGKATVTFEADDPGNPRSYIDGQIYFLRYRLDSDLEYIQAPDDLISIQVYQQGLRATLVRAAGQPGFITWDNSIQYILGQYGKLYPYMANFVDLGDYDSVKLHHRHIQGVLETELSNPSHMPVTRDLSASRRALVLGWIANGMPRS